MSSSNKPLGKSAQVVQNALLKTGLPFTVVELNESTRTANEAAVTIGCEVAQIIKSLVFCIKETNKPILILASGANRVNEKIIADELNREIIKADANFTREVTGFSIGGVAPVGHKQVIDTYIDLDLLQYEVLWAAAGTPHTVFKISSSDLVRLTHGKVISIK